MTSMLSQFTKDQLDVVRRHVVKGLTKTAEDPSAAGTEGSFEKSFSQLSHAFLQDKAPGLLDYEVGFQIIDKNEDGSKACGVMGFKVGPLWLYAPVFFIDGDLKGHELLYIKNQDLYVPMNEKWLNYLLNRRPHELGKPVSRNLREHGVLPPNIYTLKYPPTKYATEMCPKCKALQEADLPGKMCDECKAKSHMAASQAIKEAGNKALYCRYCGHGFDAHTEDNSCPKCHKPLGFESDCKDISHEKWMQMGVEPGKGGEKDAGLSGRLDKDGQDALEAVQKLAEASQTSYKVIAPETIKVKVKMKFGEHAPKMAAWAHDFLPPFAKAALFDPKSEPQPLDLPSFLKVAGLPGCQAFVNLLADYPRLMDGVEKFYGDEKIALLMREIGDTEREKRSILINRTESGQRFPGTVLPQPMMTGSTETQADPSDAPGSKEGGLHIIISTGGSILPEGKELDDAEKEKMLEGKVVIRDTRPDYAVTRVYKVQEPQKLFNPGETGLYDVLVQPDQFAKCVVFMAPVDAHRGHNHAIVVRLDGKSWLATHSTQIWVDKQHPWQEYEEWLKKLPSVDESLDRKSLQIVISPSGHQATVPFSAAKESSDGKFKTYEAHFLSGAQKKAPGSLVRPPTLPTWPRTHDRGHLRLDHDPLQNNAPHCSKIVLTGAPGKGFRIDLGELYIPSGSRVLKLDQDEGGDGSDPKPFLTLGNLPELHLNLMKHAGAEMEVLCDGTFFQLNQGNHKSQEDTVVELVSKHGLREKTARAVLDQAKVERRSLIYLNKQAAGQSYPLQQSSIPSPAFPEPLYSQEPLLMDSDSVPLQQNLDLKQQVHGLGAQVTDRSVYDARYVNFPYPSLGSHGSQPDGEAADMADQASRTGQKDVFDTSMISALVKNLRPESAVNQHLGPIMQTMSRYGKMLMNLYWNGEGWEERYGKEEIPAIEDQLKDVFEQTGELVLKLKEHEVQPESSDGILPDMKAHQDESYD